MTTETPTRTETFVCDGPVELDVRLRNGRIEVRGAKTSTVRVHLTSYPEGSGTAAADALRETRVELDGDRVLVRGPKGFARGDLSVTIEAPPLSRLKAHAHRASIAASGPLAALVAATGSGAVSADDVEGTVDVATGSGAVRLGRVAGPLRARLGAGTVEVGSLEGKAARIATGRGDLRLGIVEGDAHLRTGRGAITIGEAAGGELSLASGAGDLRVGLRAGVVAELDLVSGSGNARSELDVSDRPPAGKAAARIRMRTGSGEALVARATG
jgi:hypothetical protein